MGSNSERQMTMKSNVERWYCNQEGKGSSKSLWLQSWTKRLGLVHKILTGINMHWMWMRSLIYSLQRTIVVIKTSHSKINKLFRQKRNILLSLHITTYKDFSVIVKFSFPSSPSFMNVFELFYSLFTWP